MAEESKNFATVLVHLRNDFYRLKYYLALVIYYLCLIVIAILIGVLIFLVRNPTHPLYFATDSVGRLIEETPLQQPNMSTDQVAQWAIEAVESSHSYDYFSYRAELQDAQKYFTNYGWYNYMQSLTASNNLLALTQRKMLVIAKVVDKPKLIVEGVLGDAYAWKFQMPILVSYKLPPFDDKPQSHFENALSVTLIVQRQKILQSYKGLGIVQMIETLVVSPSSQNLAAPPS
jgi:hypothetical protein